MMGVSFPCDADLRSERVGTILAYTFYSIMGLFIPPAVQPRLLILLV